MKVVKLIFLLVVLVANTSFCQLIEINGGINRSNTLAIGFEGQTTYKTGLLSGLDYFYNLGNNLYLGAGVFYSKMGTYEEQSGVKPWGDVYKYTVNQNFDYLEMPLKVGKIYGDNITLFPRIGLFGSYLLSTKTTQLSSDTLYVFKNDIEDMRSFNIGGIIEVNGGYKLTNYIEIIASVAYKCSINGMFIKDNRYNYNPHHHGLVITSGLRFKIGDKKM